MADKLYRQYKLRSDHTILTCWLDSTRLKIGWKLSLKKDPQPDRVWIVIDAYDKIMEQPPEHRWRVGGL